ncbi:MAG: nucleotidyltransferase family protein [Alphaproteobacteria bacterium]|nr:nucleotidyltransferase family protein [Alphaproteobacteria bacterium]
MHCAEAIAVLQSHRTELQSLGVEHLYLFGSTARDQATQASDVDLFFDYRRGELSLFGLMDIQERATALLGRKVDITTRDGLHPVLRGGIEAGAVRVF